MIFFTIALGFGLLFGDLPLVKAQESDSGEFTLEEITITAEKRVENMQKTPISVSLVTSEDIQEKSLGSVQDMLQNVVGVQLQGSGGAADGDSESIFIRGIGLNNMDMQWGDPAIALNVDGVQQQRESALFSSMVDVERVEVLRGPQGTLYGRNATGGAVNVIMAQPKDHFEASGSLQFGNYNARSLEGILNVPAGSKLALRFSGIEERRDGYITGGARDRYRDNASARLKALYKPFEAMTLTGTVEYNKVKETPSESVPPSNLNSDDPWHNVDSRITATDAYNEKETWTYSLQLNLDILDWTVFTFIPTMSKWNRSSWMPFTVTGQINPSQTTPDLWEETTYTYEARFANAADSKLIWVLGGFLWDSKTGSGMGQTLVESVEPTVQFLNRPSDSWALFGQTTYSVTDRFRVVAGGRYSYDDRTTRYRIYSTNDTSGGDALVLTYDSGIKEVGNLSKKFTYKTGLEYDIAEDSMAYIQASTGYKAGGITFSQMLNENNEFTNLAETKFKPETSLAFELGSKNRFLDDTLQINGSLFYTDYENMQVQYPIMVNEGTEDEERIMRVVNAGPSKMYGIELESTWLITAMDSLTANVSSMKGTYGELIVVSGNPPGVPGFGPAVDLTGSTMANMPRFNIQLGYKHTWNIGDHGSLSASFDTNYKTAYYNRIETYMDYVRVPAHHISDLYLNWTSQTGRWSAGAYAKNLEDKAIALDIRGNGTEAMLNDPRTFGIKVSVKY